MPEHQPAAHDAPVGVRNTSRNTVVARRAFVARSFWERLFGLLFRPSLAVGEALIIEPCASIHTLGMRYAIDVLFVDRDGRIVGMRTCLKPNRLFAGARGARRTIELPCGAIAASSTRAGDMIRVEGPSIG